MEPRSFNLPPSPRLWRTRKARVRASSRSWCWEVEGLPSVAEALEGAVYAAAVLDVLSGASAKERAELRREAESESRTCRSKRTILLRHGYGGQGTMGGRGGRLHTEPRTRGGLGSFLELLRPRRRAVRDEGIAALGEGRRQDDDAMGEGTGGSKLAQLQVSSCRRGKSPRSSHLPRWCRSQRAIRFFPNFRSLPAVGGPALPPPEGYRRISTFGFLAQW